MDNQNTKIADLKQLIRNLVPIGRVLDEAKIEELLSPSTGGPYTRNGVHDTVVQFWLDRLRQEGFLRMDGFKYFRMQA